MLRASYAPCKGSDGHGNQVQGERVSKHLWISQLAAQGHSSCLCMRDHHCTGKQQMQATAVICTSLANCLMCPADQAPQQGGGGSHWGGKLQKFVLTGASCAAQSVPM